MPRTGIFGLMDLIGLDLMPLITKSMLDLLPKEDTMHKVYYEIPELSKLIKNGYTGKKGKGGFFKGKTALDLNSFKYRDIKKISSLAYKNIEEIISEDSDLGKCISSILSEFLLYVSSLIPSVSSNIYDIDQAMQLGYNWKYGPFELFTRLLPNKGFEYISKNSTSLPEYIKNKEYSNIDLNQFSSTINSLKDNSRFEIIDSNESARLLKFENLLCFEITTKMGILDHNVFNLILSSIAAAEKLNSPIVIYNDQMHFSAGANLKLFAEFI